MLLNSGAVRLNLALGQLTDEEFAEVLPTLLEEVNKSSTVVYDAVAYSQPQDAIAALVAGSATLVALVKKYGRTYGRARLHWALMIALIESHQHHQEPVKSCGNGVMNEYGRKLFGGEASALKLYKKEGWTIWDTRQPPECIREEQEANGKVWYLAPLGSSRKVLTRLRVRSLSHSSLPQWSSTERALAAPTLVHPRRWSSRVAIRSVGIRDFRPT